MQGQACQWRTGSFRNPNYLFGLWYGNYGPVQADSGQAGSLPSLFPEAGQGRTGRCRQYNDDSVKLTGEFPRPEHGQSPSPVAFATLPARLLQCLVSDVMAVIHTFKMNLRQRFIRARQSLFQ